ncbi:MAG TPA: hypothetical protein VHM70_14025 [Polyangiaceae bacterium]|nr:hypothetical protein [Polyangiaceae bacterium]
MKERILKLLAAVAVVSGFAFGAFEKPASAQEILLTGPLAGAGSVRHQRLYRKGRFEFAPSAAFTLLDEYKRQILAGARLNYNLTDWLAIGVWGGFSPEALQFDTGLSDEIQKVNANRQGIYGGNANPPPGIDAAAERQALRLTNVNVGHDFRQQLGTIQWVASPQIQLIPFRGKIAIFQSIYVDTDFYIFGGPAFVGLQERKACAKGSCGSFPQLGSKVFDMEQRMAIAPSFGIGFQFYMGRWAALGTEWRGIPFSRNVGGFDNRGSGPNGDFPDLAVNEKDREFRFNQMIVVSFGMSLPFDYQLSE